MDVLKIFVVRSGLNQKYPGIAVLGQAACYNTASCAGTTWEVQSEISRIMTGSATHHTTKSYSSSSVKRPGDILTTGFLNLYSRHEEGIGKESWKDGIFSGDLDIDLGSATILYQGIFPRCLVGGSTG